MLDPVTLDLPYTTLDFPRLEFAFFKGGRASSPSLFPRFVAIEQL